MPFYTIRHLTQYRYSVPVRENVTEARMQPRSEGHQRCFKFEIASQPRAQIDSYQDYLGNIVHHFDIPGDHVQYRLTAESHVELTEFEPLPDSLSLDSWQTLDAAVQPGSFWDFLQPSYFAHPTPLLLALSENFDLSRQYDPVTTLKRINERIYQSFAYTPQSTQVDSPIDEAIAAQRGVCQDFSHIMIALVRHLGIPCRYVSGYLYHQVDGRDRSAEDATHAWVEAYLPELGWLGFDPTNNLIAATRHIRVAVGRDYADVPPTRGVFKGTAEEELTVGVRVALAAAPLEEDESILPEGAWEIVTAEQAASQQQ